MSTAQSNGASGRWSIRAQLRVALVGVLLLILPQVSLTIYYLVEMTHTAEIAATRMRLAIDAQHLSRGLRQLELPSAVDATSTARQSTLQRVDSLLGFAAEAGDRAGEFAEADAARITDALRGHRDAIEAWFEAMINARSTAATADAFRELLGGDPAQTGFDFEPLEMQLSDTRAHIDDAIDTTMIGVFDQLRYEQDQAQLVLDHADRNLISLTMLTMIFVLVLLVALPKRLVRPLGRLVHVVRQARAGRLDAEVDTTGDDEVSHLASAFVDTMTRVREFDERKRERILEDAVKLEVLLRSMEAPTAILTRRFVVELCNRAFRELFALGSDEAELALPGLLHEGGDSLRQMLTHVLEQRDELRGQRLTLCAADGVAHAFTAGIQPCRDGRGRVTHLIVTLASAAGGAKDTLPHKLSTGAAVRS